MCQVDLVQMRASHMLVEVFKKRTKKACKVYPKPSVMLGKSVSSLYFYELNTKHSDKLYTSQLCSVQSPNEEAVLDFDRARH